MQLLEVEGRSDGARRLGGWGIGWVGWVGVVVALVGWGDWLGGEVGGWGVVGCAWLGGRADVGE